MSHLLCTLKAPEEFMKIYLQFLYIFCFYILSVLIINADKKIEIFAGR